MIRGLPQQEDLVDFSTPMVDSPTPMVDFPNLMVDFKTPVPISQPRWSISQPRGSISRPRWSISQPQWSISPPPMVNFPDLTVNFQNKCHRHALHACRRHSVPRHAMASCRMPWHAAACHSMPWHVMACHGMSWHAILWLEIAAKPEFGGFESCATARLETVQPHHARLSRSACLRAGAALGRRAREGKAPGLWASAYPCIHETAFSYWGMTQVYHWGAGVGRWWAAVTDSEPQEVSARAWGEGQAESFLSFGRLLE